MGKMYYLTAFLIIVCEADLEVLMLSVCLLVATRWPSLPRWPRWPRWPKWSYGIFYFKLSFGENRFIAFCQFNFLLHIDRVGQNRRWLRPGVGVWGEHYERWRWGEAVGSVGTEHGPVSVSRGRHSRLWTPAVIQITRPAIRDI